MAQLTVRHLDAELVRRLKIRAAENGRSAEAEHREILKQALMPDADDFWARADRMRAKTRGRQTIDSTDIIREERDRRAGLID